MELKSNSWSSVFAGVEEGNTGFSFEIQEKMHEVYGGMEKSWFSAVFVNVLGVKELVSSGQEAANYTF